MGQSVLVQMRQAAGQREAELQAFVNRQTSSPLEFILEGPGDVQIRIANVEA